MIQLDKHVRRRVSEIASILATAALRMFVLLGSPIPSLAPGTTLPTFDKDLAPPPRLH